MSGLKSRFNDITLIKDTLNIAFNEGNGAINVNSIGGTVDADISGQFVNTDISGQFVKTDISGQFVKTDISGQFVNTDISGQFVNIANFPETVLISPLVKSIDYDVVKNANLYADSTGDTTPPFIVNNRGIPGWSYLNTNPAKASNVYYYFNVPAISTTVQSNISLSNLDYFYAVIVLQHIGTNDANLPFLVVGSQATGSGDSIPGFANTRYTYTIPTATNKLVLGEPIVIYFSANADNKPPESFMPNLRRIKCQLFSILGPETSTILAYISINTQTATTRSEYVLQAAGYKFSATGGLTNVAVLNSNFVVNSPQLAESNTHDGTNNPITSTVVSTKRGLDVNIIAGGGGGGTGGVIQGISTASGLAVDITATPSGGANRLLVDTDISGQFVKTDISGQFVKTDISGQFVNIANFPENIIQGNNTVNNAAMNINATDNRLLVNSLVVGNTGNKLVINADGSINVSGGGGGTVNTDINNIHSGTLSNSTFSAPLNIGNNYGNESVISYRDTSSSITSFITIWGAFDNTSDASYFYIGVLQPVVIRTGNRYASAVLKLKGLKFIRIYNENTINTANAVSCSLFSG